MSNKAVWTGRILCGLAVLLLLFDSIGKILRTEINRKGFAAGGFDPNLTLPVGVILLICLIVFIIPRTRFLGALLLTAYLGGAESVNVLTKAPVAIILLPIVVCILIWSGPYVTSGPLRTLLKTNMNSGSPASSSPPSAPPTRS